jgi:hypothetical protein
MKLSLPKPRHKNRRFQMAQSKQSAGLHKSQEIEDECIAKKNAQFAALITNTQDQQG